MLNKNLKAFTLAEVLITLSILGVVAALTISSTYSNHQKRVLRTQLQQTYAELESISRMFMAEHDNLSMLTYHKKLVGNRDGQNENACCTKLFEEIRRSDYIPFTSTTAQNHWGGSYNKEILINNNYKDLSNQQINSRDLDDGYLRDKRGRDWFGDKFYYTISVDVNGHNKGPNRWGYDLFSFRMDENGEITPMRDPNLCRRNGNSYNRGMGCTDFAFRDVHPTDSTKKYWTDFLNHL